MSNYPATDRVLRPTELYGQAMRDYQRQRQMTLGDLLLENRVIFLQG
jgi:ATP-dependent Clp protease protease subunit